MAGFTLTQGRASDLDTPLETDSVLVYADPPFMTQRNFGEFDDRWSDVQEYVKHITDSVSHIWEHYENINLLIHVDHHACHYLKVALDGVLGGGFFRNEIIWNYNSGGASKTKLSAKHDNILVYSKGDATFNILREPYATPDVADRAGFHPDGRMLTDVWNMSIISTTSHERTGYPTQKPLALLERIVLIYSNEGELVIDPFCGSGTTGEAAVANGRRFFGGDINPEALEITRKRLENYGD